MSAITETSPSQSLTFASLHVSSGANVDTNFIFVPAGEVYDFENVYLSSETAGTMTAFECPNNGLMIAHLKSGATEGDDHQFTNLHALVDGGISGVQCVYDRTGAGTNEHTYIQVQYTSSTYGVYRPVDVYFSFGLEFLVVVLTFNLLFGMYKFFKSK